MLKKRFNFVECTRGRANLKNSRAKFEFNKLFKNSRPESPLLPLQAPAAAAAAAAAGGKAAAAHTSTRARAYS